MPGTAPNLGDVLDRGIRVADTLVTELEQELADPDSDRHKIATRLSTILRALSPVVKESRQLAKDAADWAEAMSQEDQRKVIRDFFTLMPPEEQRSLLQELTRDLNTKRKIS